MTGKKIGKKEKQDESVGTGREKKQGSTPIPGGGGGGTHYILGNG